MAINSKIINWVILGIGLFLFLWNVIDNKFVYSLIVMLCTVLIWMIINIAIDSFKIKSFAIIASISGFLLCLTVFFMYGIEEMAYPSGAIIFHSTGIAKALAIAFASSIPLLLLYQNPQSPPKTSRTTATNKQTAVVDDNEWELADSDDLTSGDWDLE